MTAAELDSDILKAAQEVQKMRNQGILGCTIKQVIWHFAPVGGQVKKISPIPRLADIDLRIVT